jgi:amidase
MDVHASILLQGGSEFMVRGNGIGMPGKGFHDAAVAEHLGRSRTRQADQLFASVKFAMVIGGYLWEEYGGAYYAKAQNLAVSMRRAYDAVLESFDVLVMPTTCITAPPLPEPDPESLAAIELALDPALISNTCAFNHTGHPALSVPVGPLDGLPVGLMLVGRRNDDATVLRAARGLEAAGHTLAEGVA